MIDPAITTLDLGDQVLRAATWGSGAPEIVMLHDGLGSITQWRSVPGEVAARSNKTVMAYERACHGKSMSMPTGALPTRCLHDEAAVLEQVLHVVAADQPWIIGHSDGGSIALLHAAEQNSTIKGVLALACHSWVEDICVDAIVKMRANRDAIVGGLTKHHGHADAIFDAWSGVWVSDAFRPWDIRPELGAISVPALIAQGERDAYATEAHAHLTAAAIGSNARSQIVGGVGHIMHHDDAQVVVDLICDFVSS